MLATVVLVLALAGPAGLALAGPAPARRVPSGVRHVSVILTFPPRVGGASRLPVRRLFRGAARVRELVDAADALKPARRRGLCPDYLRLGPELTVAFRGRRSVLATAQVGVASGSRGSSGSSACFPIHFSSRGRVQALVGNGFVRLVGRLIGTAIS